MRKQIGPAACLSGILICLTSAQNSVYAQSAEAEKAKSPFYATTPSIRPSLRLTAKGESIADSNVFYPKWVPGAEQYIQLGYKKDATASDRSIGISLHDRAGRILQDCLVDKNFSTIFDFAVMPSGTTLIVGLRGKQSAVHCYSLPNLALQWEKLLPEEQFFQVVSQYGILTSGPALKTIYDPDTGEKICCIPNELTQGYFDEAAEDGFVNFTADKCLVYVVGAYGMGEAVESPKDITIQRFKLDNGAVKAESVLLEKPRRKRAYCENAVKYEPSTDTLQMGSQTGVIDVFDASNGNVIRSVKVQAPTGFDRPDDYFNLPIPLTANVTGKTLVLCGQYGRSFGVLSVVSEENIAVPLVRGEDTRILSIHPTLPLVLFTSECLSGVGILDYQTSVIDGAILAQRETLLGNSNSIRDIFADGNTIWTRTDVYDRSNDDLCEVTEWSLFNGAKVASYRLESACQIGGFAARSGRCFLTSGYEGAEVDTISGVVKHAFSDGGLRASCADDKFFFFAHLKRGQFDLLSSRQGKTSVVRNIPRYDIGFNTRSPLASDNGHIAMSGCRRINTKGDSVIGNDHYILVLDQKTDALHEFKQEKEVQSMVWIGDRLVVVQGEKVTWYEEPFQGNAEVQRDDGQISGDVVSVHAMGKDLVVVSEHQKHMVISVCGWDAEGLFVKRDRKIPADGSRYNSNQGVAVAGGCFFYETDNYVIATRIDD